MALRHLLRHPVRSTTGILSACLAGAVLLSTMVLYRSMWFVVDFHFERVAHEDVNVALAGMRPLAVLSETHRWPGVLGPNRS